MSEKRMTLVEAKCELKANANLNFSHVVLLGNNDDGFYTEMHGGHAGNCCCNTHTDFVWRSEAAYTNESEIDAIRE